MGPLLKNATNPHFRNKYADLSAVIETISEPLNKAGLVFFQAVNYDATNNVPVLTTVLADTKSGETLESNFPIVCKDPQNPQAIGGAITCLRRYSLMAMLGLAPEDDDGHVASQRPQMRSTPPERDENRGQVSGVTTPAHDPVTGEIDEQAEKNAVMRGIMAAAKDLGMTNEQVKREMWVAYGGDTAEDDFSRTQLSLDQMTEYRDTLNKRKAKKGAAK
jgi:hypothetical protein